VLLKLAGLLHDVAKPETKALDPTGRTRFLGHPELGAGKATRICERLRFGNKETRFVSLLVEEHLRPTQLANSGPPSARALYRFFRDLGDAAPALLTLTLADGAAAAGPRLTRERWQRHVAFMAYVLEHGQSRLDAASKQPRLITGNDLIEALGMAPGPELGRVLAAVQEAIGAGEVGTREEAIEYARGMTPPPRSPSPLAERGRTQEVEKRWLTPPQLWDRLKPAAREMRSQQTAAEAAMWQLLRRQQIDGHNFRRQHAIGPYIADFYSPKAKLVIEVDGGSHDLRSEEDQLRDDHFLALGIRTLRCSNEQVLSSPGSVIDLIRRELASETSPSPPAGRGSEGEGSNE
jgi:very-short-patch-repair endonuclease